MHRHSLLVTLLISATQSIRLNQVSICGDKPVDMSEFAICDALTAQWTEMVVAEATNGGCAGEPPVEAGLSVCNTETGLWETELIAVA